MTTTTTRRAVLAGTATALATGSLVNLAALAMAKAENGSVHAAPFPASDKLSFAADLSPRGEMSDPIFAAIERHKALYDAVEAAECGSSLEEQERLDAEVDKINAIRDQILAAPFLTPAGMAAALRFLIEFELEAFDYTEHGGAFLRRLADALDRQAVLS